MDHMLVAPSRSSHASNERVCACAHYGRRSTGTKTFRFAFGLRAISRVSSQLSCKALERRGQPLQTAAQSGGDRPSASTPASQGGETKYSNKGRDRREKSFTKKQYKTSVTRDESEDKEVGRWKGKRLMKQSILHISPPETAKCCFLFVVTGLRKRKKCPGCVIASVGRENFFYFS